MQSHATEDTSTGSEDDKATTKPARSSEDLPHSLTNGAHRSDLETELERLQTLALERESAERELADKYAQLESQHSEALDLVEELKTEVTRARATEASSPRTSTPIIRRKSSQNLLIDRAHRSFASLRNIAADNFEGKPEVMQNFELNINSAMHELHSRSERIQELENELSTGKKEMETKMTIISGLTRERSSLKASPMDMPMVANLRDQLEKSELQLSSLREAHAAREEELSTELDTLRKALASKDDGSAAELNDVNGDYERQVAHLQSELSAWETKHKEALDAMESTEKDMRATIAQLEEQVGKLSQAQATEQKPASLAADERATAEADQKQENLINFLRSEIDEYKAIINSNATKVADLENAHASVRAELSEVTKARELAESNLEDMSKAHESVKAGLEEATKARELAAAEAARFQELVKQLEEQISSHEQAAKSHQEGLDLLKANHSKELEELKAQEQKSYEDQVEVLLTEHAEALQRLEAESNAAKDELHNVAAMVAAALGVEVSTAKLDERINALASSQKALEEERKTSSEMESHVAELTTINDAIMKDLEAAKAALAEVIPDAKPSLSEQALAVKAKLTDLEGRNKKNSRLVEELEEQLQNNFDEAQATNNRLSTLQSERNSQLEEVSASRTRMQLELETIRDEYANLQVCFDMKCCQECFKPNTIQARYDEVSAIADGKRTSTNSTIRKSSSHTSLPSPPPAIPLPPLPNGASSPAPSINSTMVPSSPTTMRPASKDNMSSINQITEDQEARIRTIEKHLYAERQLTQTLEEALTDLEKQSNKVKADCDAWKRRAGELEVELKETKDKSVPESQQDNRWSMQAVEEERKKRQAAEAARKQLEERMNAINKGKKKKGSLNCF
jgi:kinesin family protein 4/21/27